MATEKRLIDAEPIKKFIVDSLNNPDQKKAFGYDAIEILTEIEFAPTVDAVEVVRCKDCVYYCDFDTHFDCRHSCGMDSVRPNDFCSYGERRAEDG